MILVTGGTGFIGGRVVEKLLQSGEPVRLLIRPNRKTPRLPKNVPLNIAVSHISDERGMRTALREVDTVFHFATAEHQGPNADLEAVDVEGTRCLLDAARETGVKQILFLGRIGADKSSSYPVLKAKALAEDYIRKQDIPYCILRLTDIFGAHDHFTLEIATGLKRAPIIFPLPGEGNILVQPLWIEDLISIIMLIFEQKRYKNEVIEVGGGEFFEFHQVVRTVMN
jgi:NADH dehydrogenase